MTVEISVQDEWFQALLILASVILTVYLFLFGIISINLISYGFLNDFCTSVIFTLCLHKFHLMFLFLLNYLFINN